MEVIRNHSQNLEAQMVDGAKGRRRLPPHMPQNHQSPPVLGTNPKKTSLFWTSFNHDRDSSGRSTTTKRTNEHHHDQPMIYEPHVFGPLQPRLSPHTSDSETKEKGGENNETWTYFSFAEIQILFFISFGKY